MKNIKLIVIAPLITIMFVRKQIKALKKAFVI